MPFSSTGASSRRARPYFALRREEFIARISLRQTAQVVVAITGDSDLIPAFKFARREGVRVYLDHLGLPIRRELKVHADIVI